MTPDNLLRFYNPGREYGRRCEKCWDKMIGHQWIDIDPHGKIVRCSVSEGIQKKP